MVAGPFIQSRVHCPLSTMFRGGGLWEQGKEYVKKKNSRKTGRKRTPEFSRREGLKYPA